MRRMINGKWVDCNAGPDGQVNTEDLKEAANIPPDRSLVLQAPDGSNRVLPSNVSFAFPKDFNIIDVPAHRRGK